jgi:3-phosphoshikimate 1-carboxyvinyltransferase
VTVRELRVPGDKSISHRALIVAALSPGASRIRGILRSGDVASTAAVLRMLGADVGPLSDEMVVRGRALRALEASDAPLDCGNSGTTARLVAGVVAAHRFTSRFIGDASLSRRPMRRVAAPLSAMGARIALEHSDGLPMVIHGGDLVPLDWSSPIASAQVKSAVLFAGLVGGVRVSVREPSPSRDHTERMLRSLAVPVRTDGAFTELEPIDELPPLDLSVPGDPSSAAFFAAWAALARAELRLSDVALNPTRSGFLHALRRMGASVSQSESGEAGGESVGDVVVSGGELSAITVDAEDVPSLIDELPLLACVAARAAGTTTIRGAAELRVKESDRIAATISNLRAIGVDCEELPDGMRITGSTSPLRGAVRTFGDHRLAMAFGVLGALPDSELVLDDRDCVDVSYPGFFEDLVNVAS